MTQQIKDLLTRLSSGRLGRRIQWTLQSRDTVDRLRSSFETQKSAIEVALQCGFIQILCAILDQVERPHQDLERLNEDARATREHTEALRIDAIEIKQSIREEAQALLREVARLQHHGSVSTELREFYRVSQAFAQTVTSPDPEVGFLTSDLTQSSLNVGSNTGSGAAAMNDECSIATASSTPSNQICNNCGHPLPSSAENPDQVHPSTNNSNLEESPPEYNSTARAPIEETFVRLTIKYGGQSASKTYPFETEAASVFPWIYDTLIHASKNRQIWILDIKSPANIRCKVNGTPFLHYPGENSSDLAGLYGSTRALSLDIEGVSSERPDIQKCITAATIIDPLIHPEHLQTLLVPGLFWVATSPAPVAWCVIGDKVDLIAPGGGVIHPGKSLQLTTQIGHLSVNTLSREPPLQCHHQSRSITIHAVLTRLGEDLNHWQRLIHLTAEEDRWKHTFDVSYERTSWQCRKCRRRLDRGSRGCPRCFAPDGRD